jgi:quinol monooxygenase YgiN
MSGKWVSIERPSCGRAFAASVAVATSASRSFALRTASITADLLDPGRVNLFERWETQAAVEAFRGSGPGNKQGAAMLSVSVAEYDIADVRPSFGEGRA